MDQAESLRRWVREYAPEETGRPGSGAVILVVGAMPGVGATTVAQQLAVAWKRRGLPAAWIDGSRTAPCGGRAGGTVRATLDDVLTLERTLSEAWTTGPGGIVYLAGSLQDEPREQTFDAQHAFVDQLRWSSRQRHVLVDVDDREELTVLAEVADHCMVVTDASADAVQEAYRTVKWICTRLRHGQISLLMNRVVDANVARRYQQRLQATCDRHLNLDFATSGQLPLDAELSEATRSPRGGYFRHVGQTEFQTAVDRLTERLDVRLTARRRDSLSQCAK